MIYTIENELLKVKISDVGAEMVSLYRKDNDTEYLWQADPTYWAGTSPNLFPIVGRLTDGKYTYKGKTYEMLLHGFTRKMPLAVAEQTADSIRLVIRADEETMKVYPFDFEYSVAYTLCGDTVRTEYTAANHGENTMYFAFGGHTGYNIPLGNEGKFEDYYIQFGEGIEPAELKMKECYMTDEVVPYKLEEGEKYYLHHDMFDNDAIVLEKTGGKVVLASDTDSRSVTVAYPDMKYVGFWHLPMTTAPYMCIEPWMSLPAYYGVIDDMETKRDMTALKQGESYSTYIDITVK